MRPTHHRSPATTRCRFDTPVQLATASVEPPTSPGWIHEIKYDGYRLRVVVEGGAARVLTRNGADWSARFTWLAQAALALPISSAILDGEVVATRSDGVSDFSRLQAALASGSPDALTYMVFDLLYLDGHDLRDVPLVERKGVLREMLHDSASAIRYVEHFETPGAAFHRGTCEVGLEGSVSKRADRPYEPGRSHDWIKVKCRQRQEFVVLGWTEPQGSRPGISALLLGVQSHDGLRYAGRVGSGFSNRERVDLLETLGRLNVPAPPIPEPPGLARIGHHWVRPELVVEIAFAEWTADGLLRHPTYLGLREDKPAGEVSAEPIGLSVEGVTLTNPDKVLFAPGDSGDGVTKRDLARYYEAVADRMLPYLAGRPLTLVRCPHGTARDCFYQKHPDMRGLPPALRTVEIAEARTRRTYLWIDDVAGLVSLAQLGVLEIHAWNSLESDPERPDRMVFDLDPGPGVGWLHIRDTALLLRDALLALGIASFVKSTGGSGLHVVAPIIPDHDFEQVLPFARALVERLAAADPAHLTARMSKALRPERIFIDYLRNAHGATAVAAYSTRARPGGPLSVPLRWDELTDRLDTAAFTIATVVPHRLDALAGTDPWEGFAESRTRLDATMFAALGVPLQISLEDR